MLVYADRERQAQPRAEIDRLSRLPARLARSAGRLPRHEALVAAFIAAAELAQGLADLGVSPRGADKDIPAATAAMALLRILAGALRRSWEGKALAHQEDWPEFRAGLDALAAAPLPRTIRCRQQEGYAFYALYPESYADAAAQIARPVEAVVGIRSIGIGLAAIAAEAVGAPLLVSVRPSGFPFERVARFSAATKRKLRAVHGIVAIADEGPGLSGSSFAAVSRALSEIGIGEERQRFLPSHPGEPGPAAPEHVRAVWAKIPRQPIACDPAAPDLRSGIGSLAEWCADLTGPATAPLTDLGRGWPGPAAGAPRRPAFERRKFLLHGERGCFLLRFAGLGHYGMQTLHRARRLSRGGWTPEVLGLRHGFLVERWVEEARALPTHGQGREDFLTHLAAYLAFRHRRLPAAPGSGASLQTLAAMAVQNASEAMGITLPLQLWRQRAQALEDRVRPIMTDGRLHRWEWLVGPDDCILKADALDHCAGHDLIGCQDIAWDVAGAIAEHDLKEEEASVLLREMRRRGAPVDRELLAFLAPCYLAFQLGLWTPAGAAASTVSQTRLHLDYGKKLHLKLCTTAFPLV